MIFGRRLGCISSSDKSNLPDIHEFVHCVQQIFVQSANMTLIPPKMAHYLKLPVWKRFEEAAGKALDLAFQYVDENARQIDTQDESSQGIIRQLMSDGEIALDEISRIIVDLFIAAADTVSRRKQQRPQSNGEYRLLQTSHATQWALYLLSRHRNVQEQLFQEIQQVTNGEPVQEKHLSQLSLVKGVIKESLRYAG